MRIPMLLLAFAILVARLPAQVFEVNGGSSSLFQADGATLTMHGPSYDGSVGAGVVAGHFLGGAKISKMIGASTYVAGEDYIPFQMPTDIFDSSHYLVALGAGVKTTLRNTSLFAFAGATSMDFSSPFFEGAQAETPAAILFLDKRLAPGLEASAKTVFSGPITAIGSLAWRPREAVKLGLSGGVGANQPYGAVSLDATSRRFDVKAAYIEAGSGFHRVALQMPTASEPDRENIVVNFRPAAWMSLSAGRQNFLSPSGLSQQSVRGTVNELSGSVTVARLNLSSSLYQSTYLGQSNVSTAYGASTDFLGRVHATANYLESRAGDGPKSDAVILNVSETLTPRWSVTEVVSRSAGATTLSFGGGFLSNRASISAEYETYYTPERIDQPFEEALLLDVKLHVFAGITLHGSTFVQPTGQLGYTADLQGMLVGSGSMTAGNSNSDIHAQIAPSVLSGRVIDKAGNPVEGAAVLIDQTLVYTDDDGRFSLRERRSRPHQFKVDVKQFLTARRYRVLSAPPVVRSSSVRGALEIAVIVEPDMPPGPGN